MGIIEKLLRKRLGESGALHMVNQVDTSRHSLPSKAHLIQMMEKISKLDETSSDVVSKTYISGFIDCLKYVIGDISESSLPFSKNSSSAERNLLGMIVHAVVNEVETGSRRVISGRVIFQSLNTSVSIPSMRNDGWYSNEDAALFMFSLAESRAVMNSNVYDCIVAFSDGNGIVKYGYLLSCGNVKVSCLSTDDGFSIPIKREYGKHYLVSVREFIKSCNVPCRTSIKKINDNLIHLVVEKSEDLFIEYSLTELASLLIMSGVVRNIV